MGKRNKLEKFAEMKEMDNVFEFPFESSLKGTWKTHFGDAGRIILELGCGTGKYTISLAQMFKDDNFIGIDIKGSRIWKGAKFALENKLANVAFLRTKIEMLTDHFEKNEVDEIWITFPDPQPKKENKRLSCKIFLDIYKNILKDNGIINLKTDDKDFFDFSLETFQAEGLEIKEIIEDLYKDEITNPLLQIQTDYEKKHLERGRNIYYLKGKI